MEIKDLLTEVASGTRDAAYTAVGIGVLSLQQVSTHRREIARRLVELEEAVSPVVDRLDSSLEPIEPYLPPPAHALVDQARATRKQWREYLASLAA
jgi:hypothetical protein